MSPNQKIHIIGIAGAGVSGVAVMLRELGHTVTGSDEGFYEPTTSYLKRHGIDILTPYKKENIPANVDMIIIGKHSKLSAEDLPAQAGNEEVKEALTMQDKVRSFPQVLGEITKERQNIVVAGSYGKSTCSALLAWCLIESDVDAGYFFGAIPVGFDNNSHVGTDKHFVMEGDEYPAYDGPSKFLYLNPRDILLTSCEHDHVNVFPTLESYVEPYKKLMALMPEDGLLVAGINNPNVQEVAALAKGRVVTYGLDPTATWYPSNIKYGVKTTFDLYKNDQKVTELSTTLLGTHNIENIVGVSAYLLEKNLITIDSLVGVIASFGGLKRRLDLKTNNSQVLVYEGFGSSYKKAKTVFDAIKLHFPNKRIITVFEPHTFSWRNKNNLDWYNDIFADSDETIIWKPPEHGSLTHDQASLEDILNVVKKNKAGVQGVETKEEALKILEDTVKNDDVIILMSSGDLGGLIEEVPKWVEQKFPK